MSVVKKVKKKRGYTVRDKLHRWGKARGKDSVELALAQLMNDGLTTQQIAKKFKCSVTAIRNFLITDGSIAPKSCFLERLKELGYSGPEAFFTDPDNVRKTFKTLGDELGFCYVTISAHYNEFRQAMSETEE